MGSKPPQHVLVFKQGYFTHPVARDTRWKGWWSGIDW